jgi:type II restriction enzyme
MLTEPYFPYILFLEGSNFLTQNITIIRLDGSTYTIAYDDGTLNRLDRLTAANYGMPINTNLCENKFVSANGLTIMLQAASIYTQGNSEHWKAEDMIEIMLDVARTSLSMIGKDLFHQLTK